MNTTTDPKILNTRVSLAEAALQKIAAKCTALEERERDATRELANDPTDANATKVREVRTALDDWRAGRNVAVKNVETARADVEAAATAARKARCDELTRLASLEEIAQALEPLLVQIVDAYRMEAKARAAIEAMGSEQAERAAEIVGLGGASPLPNHALTRGRVEAFIAIAIARSGERPLSDSDYLALARGADARVDIQALDVMPALEQLAWGLRGRDTVAEIAERKAKHSSTLSALAAEASKAAKSVLSRVGAS